MKRASWEGITQEMSLSYGHFLTLVKAKHAKTTVIEIIIELFS